MKNSLIFLISFSFISFLGSCSPVDVKVEQSQNIGNIPSSEDELSSEDIESQALPDTSSGNKTVTDLLFLYPKSEDYQGDLINSLWKLGFSYDYVDIAKESVEKYISNIHNYRVVVLGLYDWSLMGNFSNSDLSIIKSFLKSGGSVYIAVDNESRTLHNDFMREFGVSLNGDNRTGKDDFSQSDHKVTENINDFPGYIHYQTMTVTTATPIYWRSSNDPETSSIFVYSFYGNGKMVISSVYPRDLFNNNYINNNDRRELFINIVNWLYH